MNKQLKILSLFLLLTLFSLQFASAVVVDVLSSDPAPLKAGEFADITLSIESSVSEADLLNAELYIKETDFIQSISNTKTYDLFRSGRSATETFRVFISEELPGGYVDLEIVLSTKDNVYEFSERVFVEASDSEAEIHIGAIQSTPQELLPDTDNNQIVFTLQNLGEKDAELVNVELISDKELIKASYSFSMKDNAANINSGEGTDFSFTVDIDETARGEIPSSLEIQYRTKDKGDSTYKTNTKIIPFNLEIIDAPLLTVINVEQVSDFIGGTPENKVIVTIRNDGLEDAKSVRVRVTPDISYPFLFEKTTQYISSIIEPGQESTVEFVAEVNSDAQDKTYNLAIKLESLVGEARYVREDTLPLTAQAGKTTSVGTVGLIIILVVVFFALLIGYRTYQSKKKEERTHRKKR